jgi:hypothetical protein
VGVEGEEVDWYKCGGVEGANMLVVVGVRVGELWAEESEDRCLGPVGRRLGREKGSQRIPSVAAAEDLSSMLANVI